MNCNVTILTSFYYGTGQGFAELQKGEVYSGTASDGGGIVFHVTLPNGKIAPVLLESNDERIKLIMYANTTKEQAPRMGR